MKKIIPLFCLLLGLGTSIAFAQQSSSPKLLYEDGFRYANGINKPFDPEKAISLFNKAANEGYAPAMNALGNLYTGKPGVARNTELAVTWFKKASDAGYSTASYNLGRLYQKGELVAQNFAEAARYYRQGAAAGDLNCKNELAYFYFKGLGVQQDYKKAFVLFQEIALKGHTNAQYFLGICYRNGYGTVADQALSKKWLQKAADKKDRQAIHELTSEPLPENMSTITPELQRKVASLKKYNEQFMAASTNNIAGEYQGFAVYYDFSKTYVHSIVPLQLVIRQTPDGYEGTWTEDKTLSAGIKAVFSSNNLLFDSSSQYIRKNYYSYGAPEKYLFRNAALGIKYIGDSMYLSGDVQFYSLGRREPGHPMYITVGKKISDVLGAGDFKFALSPNPAASFVKTTFTLPNSQSVILQLMTVNGVTLQRIEKKALPAGTYTYDFNLSTLPAGTYLLHIITDKGSSNEITKTFIKL